MSRTACALCGKTGTTFARVQHAARGRVLLCEQCLEQEREHLRLFRGGGGCGCNE